MQVHCVKAFGALSDIVHRVGGISTSLSSPASNNKAHLRHSRLRYLRPLLRWDRQSFLQHYVSSAQALLQQAGAYPAGLVLHSWAGSADMTRQLACTEGIYFSISGHTLGLSDKKLAPMLQQVRRPVLQTSSVCVTLHLDVALLCDGPILVTTWKGKRAHMAH